jgi:hypothetical protein
MIAADRKNHLVFAQYAGLACAIDGAFRTTIQPAAAPVTRAERFTDIDGAISSHDAPGLIIHS